MRLIEPEAVLWAQGQDSMSHVARCARVCYASSRVDTDDDKMRLVARLQENKHLSMFRHQSFYYYLPANHTVPIAVMNYVLHNQYCGCVVHGSKKQRVKETFLVLNGQFVLEHKRLVAELEKYQVSEMNYIKLAAQHRSKRVRNEVLLTVRHTVCVVTQISTSRELNRTSPNNIAEQSTRYVNFGKRGGGICICKPAQWDEWTWWQRKRMKLAWWLSEKMYLSLVRHSMADKNFNEAPFLPPQHAREVLPLATATKVVYTYSGKEWQHIFDLRLRGTTGKPHPNAQEVAALIRDEIMDHCGYYKVVGIEL